MTLEETGFLICDILSFKADSESIVTKLKSFTEADWDGLLAFSFKYKLMPLLYSNFSKYKNKVPIPLAVMELLWKQYMNSAARSACFYHEIKNLLRILSDNKIDVILLKGAYIAEKFYEKSALRPMCDIDILVKKEDVNNTFDVLLKKGYSTEIKYDRAFHLPIYTKNNILIEVHWDISPHLYFSWKKAVPMDKTFINTLKENLYGMEISAFPVEHLIVYLCDKVIRDNFRGMLLLLYDIALIISESTVDWDKLVSVANEWSCVKDVFCVLYLSKNLYFANIPEHFLNNLKSDGFNDGLMEFMYGELFGTSKLNSNHVHIMQMISHKNLFVQIKRIFRPENLQFISNDKNANPSTRKISFIFNRLRHLTKQYGNIFCSRQFQNGKDISKFFKWLKN